MKVAHIHLENFKRFKTLDIPVRNSLTEDVTRQFLILGDNGSGKTTVLQAVALALSLATGKTRQVSEFEWLGWLPGRYERWGTPVVELEIHFEDDEIAATQEIAEKFRESMNGKFHPGKPFIMPGSSRVVTLRLEGGSCRAGTPEEYFQFRGRGYASKVVKTVSSARTYFDRLPGVFWFDQLRNLGSPVFDLSASEGSGESHESPAYEMGVSRLRRYLNDMHLSKIAGASPPFDFLTEIEAMYKSVFHGRSFAGLEAVYTDGNPTPSGYYFMLTDGTRSYDLQEMSAGEQAVFPVIYRFAQQRIRHSIVLIDEVDLNLHPPLAQAFVNALPRMGQNCQFLLSTHSEAVTSIISQANTHRLEGGKLCL